MSYSNMVDRTEAASLIPEDAADEIIAATTEKSFVLTNFDRVPMSRKQRRLPILDRKPVAYFVNGDSGLKQTSDAAWSNLFLNAEELAVLVPIPDTVVADSAYDLWGLLKPQITEAMGAKVDDAVLFGTGKPSLWPNGVITDALNAGNSVDAAPTTGTHDIYDDLNLVLNRLEEDGYEPNAWLMRTSMRAILRNTRDANRGFMYPAAGPANTGGQKMKWAGEVWNIPAAVSKMGLSGFAAGASGALAFAFDTSMFKVAIRNDIEMRMFDQGVITDGAGVVLLNLMQQDTRVLRVIFRLAWVAANPVTLLQPSRAASYPAAVLLQGTYVPPVVFGTEADPEALGTTAGAPALPGDTRRSIGQDQPAATPQARPSRQTANGS
jgi:HK97 family phage major capsid protein